MNYNNINVLSIILILILYYTQYKISVLKRHRVKKVKVKYSDLLSVLKILSLDMNNQGMDVYYDNNQLLKLVKYQIDNKWGIKIILNFDGNLEVYEFAIGKLSDHNIQYNYNNKTSDPFIEIDIKNNLEEKRHMDYCNYYV